MANDPGSPFGFNDPFTVFWTDFVKRVAPAGATPPSPSTEAMNQMRRAFFDALAQYFDQFMRSEAFLGAMKQSMDHAMSWQNMFNQYVQKGLSAAQMPSRVDTDHVAMLVRGLEERVLDKLDELHRRVDVLEHHGKPEPARKAAK